VGWRSYVWVAIGSALGGVARYWLTGFVAILLGPQFPWGTILINIIGTGPWFDAYVPNLFGFATPEFKQGHRPGLRP